jgi:hypothetical protein
MALTAYLSATRRLLHDASGKYFTDTELTSDINQARQRIGLDTGSVRGLFTFYISSGQEVYPYQGALASIDVSNAGAGYTAAPTISFSGGGGSGATASASISSGTVSALTITANGTGFTAAPTVTFTGGTAGTAATATASIMSALDINSITVNYQNSWQMLGYANFTLFQARARYYRSTTGNPEVWSEGPPAGSGGGRAFYLFYIPNQSYQTDIDAIVLPNPLVDDTTAEQLVYPNTDLVPYYAAYLAKYNQQMFDESARFLAIYDELLRRGNSAKYQRRIPNPYLTG